MNTHIIECTVDGSCHGRYWPSGATSGRTLVGGPGGKFGDISVTKMGTFEDTHTYIYRYVHIRMCIYI